MTRNAWAWSRWVAVGFLVAALVVVVSILLVPVLDPIGARVVFWLTSGLAVGLVAVTLTLLVPG